MLVTVKSKIEASGPATYPAKRPQNGRGKVGSTWVRQVQGTHSASLGPPVTHVLGSTPRPASFPFVVDLELLHDLLAFFLFSLFHLLESPPFNVMFKPRHTSYQPISFDVAVGANSATKVVLPNWYILCPTDQPTKVQWSAGCPDSCDPIHTW